MWFHLEKLIFYFDGFSSLQSQISVNNRASYIKYCSYGQENATLKEDMELFWSIVV